MKERSKDFHLNCCLNQESIKLALAFKFRLFALTTIAWAGGGPGEQPCLEVDSGWSQYLASWGGCGRTADAEQKVSWVLEYPAGSWQEPVLKLTLDEQSFSPWSQTMNSTRTQAAADACDLDPLDAFLSLMKGDSNSASSGVIHYDYASRASQSRTRYWVLGYPFSSALNTWAIVPFHLGISTRPYQYSRPSGLVISGPHLVPQEKYHHSPGWRWNPAATMTSWVNDSVERHARSNALGLIDVGIGFDHTVK